MSQAALSIQAVERSSVAEVWLRLLLIAITLAGLGGIAAHEFVGFDDGVLISQNPRYNPPTWSSVLAYLHPKNSDYNFYIPVTSLVWGGLAHIAFVSEPDATGSRLNPWVYHSASIIVHLASVLLVYALLRRFLLLCRPSSRVEWPSFVGAAIFAVHPIQAETVAWACGMRDLLAAFFTLLCMLGYLRMRSTPAASPGKRWMWYGLATACLILAFGSKPAAVTAPLAILTIDVLILGTPLRDSMKLLWPWFVLMVPLTLITRAVQPQVWTDFAAPLVRPLIATDTLAFYIGKLLWPVGLTFDYGRTPQVALAHGWPYYDWIVPAALAALLVWKGRRNKLILSGSLIAVIFVLPVLGFLPFIAQDYSTVSNHYLYPSMLGIGLIAADLVLRFDVAWIKALSLLIISLWTIQSIRAAAVWADNRTLYTHALKENPNSWIACGGYAGVLASEGDLDGAVRYYRMAEQMKPTYGFTHMQLAMLLLKTGDADGALQEFEELLRVFHQQRNFDPQLAVKAQMAIGGLLLQRNHPAEAVQALEEAFALDPSQPQLQALLAKARAAKAASQPATLPANPR